MCTKASSHRLGHRRDILLIENIYLCRISNLCSSLFFLDYSYMESNVMESNVGLRQMTDGQSSNIKAEIVYPWSTRGTTRDTTNVNVGEQSPWMDDRLGMTDVVVARDIDLSTPNISTIRDQSKTKSWMERLWMQIPREQDIYRNRLISKAAYLTCRMLYLNNQAYILDSTICQDINSQNEIVGIQKVESLPESAVILLNVLEAWYLQVVEPPPILRPDDVLDPTSYASKLKSWYERLERKTTKLVSNECDPRIAPYICLGSKIRKQVESNMYNILQSLEIYGTDRDTLQKIFGDKYGLQFSYKKPDSSEECKFNLDLDQDLEIQTKMKKIVTEYTQKVTTPHLVPRDSVISITQPIVNPKASILSSRNQSLDDLKVKRTPRRKSDGECKLGSCGSPSMTPEPKSIKTPRSARVRTYNSAYTPEWLESHTHATDNPHSTSTVRDIPDIHSSIPSSTTTPNTSTSRSMSGFTPSSSIRSIPNFASTSNFAPNMAKCKNRNSFRNKY